MSDEVTVSANTAEPPRGDGATTFIGRYKILQKIGEGGFGEVFEAEQSQPVKRRVALKVIKLGMDTRDVIARFEAERQALAMMDHPHIARVLDAGATDNGRPYFVMELVQGEPISSYCDKHNLSIVERLRLFEQVCTAVQHAHTKGVIHRDLKPGNVLVSTQEDQPFAKVIDFGIAKATGARLTDKTLFTAQDQMIGTPLYMSPEQAEGSADIDTRTDIYSLGVLLYKLLTGSTPFESVSIRTAAMAEFQRIIREVEPLRPSTCVSQQKETLSDVAAQRRTDPGRLTRLLRGELDWIVMKAIEKDRSRRYETANGLAMDVRRYLSGEPVLAAPPSAWYRLRKLVRRHKGAVAAGLMVAAALIAGVIGFAWQASIASEQARIAEQRAAELEQVSKFQAEMLGQVDPTEAGELLSEDIRARFAKALARANLPDAERVKQLDDFNSQWQQVNATDAARELIDRTILKPAVQAIEKQFKNQPLVDATLRQVLAVRYEALGLHEVAMPLQEHALATRRRLLGNEHPDTLDSTNSMGGLLESMGRLDEAEAYLREAMTNSRRALGEVHPSTLTAINNFGALLVSQGKLSEAEPYYREALEKRRRVLGEEHLSTLSTIVNIGALQRDQGKFSEAEPYMREALELHLRVLGGDHPSTLGAINNLGAVLQSQAKLSEAEPYFRDALEKCRRVFGEEHPNTLSSINNMGSFLRAQGRLLEAEPFFREALEKIRRVLGDEHPNTLGSLNNLGSLLQAQGKLSEAEPYMREALEKYRRLLGGEHPNAQISLINMGSLLVAQGRYVEASELLTPAEAAIRKSFTGGDKHRTAKFLMHLGKARAGLHIFAAAEANLLEAHGIYVETRGPTHKDTLDCNQALIALYNAWHSEVPTQGYAAKAAQWQAKLDEVPAPTK